MRTGKTIRVLIVVVASLLLIAVAAVLVLAVPPLTKARDLVRSGNASENPIPMQVRQTICFVETISGENGIPHAVRSHVARSLALVEPKNRAKPLWHLRVWSTTALAGAYLTEDEIWWLYAEFLPYENGNGLQNAARMHFAKPIDKLSVDETIVLLAIARSPTRFSPHVNPTAAADLQKRLLEKYLLTIHMKSACQSFKMP